MELKAYVQAFAQADFHGAKWAYGEHFYAGHKKAGFEDLATLANNILAE